MGDFSENDLRLAEHVDRFAAENPPIDLATVDYTIRDPATVSARYGHVLDYMARVELEVDRNVLELTALLPNPPEIDRHFYADVWQPQEIQHGIILDRLQMELGRDGATPDLTTVSLRLRILGMLAHLGSFQDVARMLYYLTGAATERSAVLAYNRLYDGLTELREDAAAETVVAQIRRQEPGHFAFYSMSARGLWAGMAPWQKWTVRRLRSISFTPVGAYNRSQVTDFGEVMMALGMAPQHDEFAAQISRIERELLWAHRQGLGVPMYILRAFREAVQLAEIRGAQAA